MSLDWFIYLRSLFLLYFWCYCFFFLLSKNLFFWLRSGLRWSFRLRYFFLRDSLCNFCFIILNSLWLFLFWRLNFSFDRDILFFIFNVYRLFPFLFNWNRLFYRLNRFFFIFHLFRLANSCIFNWFCFLSSFFFFLLHRILIRNGLVLLLDNYLFYWLLFILYLSLY